MNTIHKRNGQLAGGFLLLAGFLLMIYQERLAFPVFRVLGFVIFLASLYSFFHPSGHKTDPVVRRNSLLLAFLAFFFSFNAAIPARFLAWMIVLEVWCIGIILLIDTYLQWRSQGQLRMGSFLDGLFHFLLGGVALLHFQDSISMIYAIFGGVIVLRGISILRYEHSVDQLPRPNHVIRRKSWGVPLFLSAILPVRSLQAINHKLNPQKSQPVLIGSNLKEGQKPDLQVWIHTARKGFEMFGHVDLSFEGKTYAYGLYDVDHSYLFGLAGRGVLFTLNSEDYLHSLEKEDWRAVTSYGMVLTDAQKVAISERIKELMRHTQPISLTSPSQQSSYLGKLAQDYPVSTYRFIDTSFKTYFVMTTNCVLLADTILEAIGTDHVANHGILTPGTYLDYFEREYQNPSSAVVSKVVVGRRAPEA